VAQVEGISTDKSRLILLCDDELILRKVARKMIIACGYDVEVFDSGRDLIDYVEKEQGKAPSAVIIDLQMPDMDGVALFRYFRRTFPLLPVIISTGHVDEEIISSAKTIGVSYLLYKPYSILELGRVLNLALASTEH